MTDALVLSTSQLNDMGLTRQLIAGLVKQGRLTRLRRGYYSMTPIADEYDRHAKLLRANVDLTDDSNVISHTSAATMHGLPVAKRELERVTMTRTTSGHMNKGPHLLVRNTILAPEEFERWDGMLITTMARTVADVARTQPFMWGVAAADAALALEVPAEALAGALERHPGLSGIRKARRVVAFADGRPESAAESLSRANMLIAGLPPADLQPELYDDDGEFAGRPDFYWEDYGVVGECDGFSKYTTLLRPGQTIEDILRAEKEREARLRRMGLWVVRWGWDEARDPKRLLKVVSTALFGKRSHVA